jgi:hypothetical protein
MSSWWLSLIKGPADPQIQPDTNLVEYVRLPGGRDDPGIMESQVTSMFTALIWQAHPDITRRELVACFRDALNQTTQKR